MAWYDTYMQQVRRRWVIEGVSDHTRWAVRLGAEMHGMSIGAFLEAALRPVVREAEMVQPWRATGSPPAVDAIRIEADDGNGTH